MTENTPTTDLAAADYPTRVEPELPVSELFDRIRDGLRLIVFAPTQTASRELLDYLGSLLEEETNLVDFRVRRTHGQEALLHVPSGGRLYFGPISTSSSRLWAMTVDAVYLYRIRWADIGGRHDRLTEALFLGTRGSALGELVEC